MNTGECPDVLRNEPKNTFKGINLIFSIIEQAHLQFVRESFRKEPLSRTVQWSRRNAKDFCFCNCYTPTIIQQVGATTLVKTSWDTHFAKLTRIRPLKKAYALKCMMSTLHRRGEGRGNASF